MEKKQLGASDENAAALTANHSVGTCHAQSFF